LIFSIDHIVFAATPEQRDEVMGALRQAGFPPVDFRLDFPENASASESVGFRGGSSLEFVFETGPPGGPAEWFGQVPRVIGLGFSSDDFERDTAWDPDPGAWVMPEQQGFPNSAGPHEHFSDFYVFVMNRKDRVLQFPGLTEGPRLARITLTGADAGLWRERLGRWLQLPARADGLAVGDVELAFEEGPHPSVRATLSFEVAGDPAVIPLAAGEIILTGGSPE
jgi:hypothetical protein